MVRIDAQSRANVAAEIEEAIAAAIKANLPAADVVVVSDYARGRCKDLIFACQSKWRKRPSEGLDHYPKRNRLTGAAMVGVLGDTVLAAQTRKDDANLLLCGKLPPGRTALQLTVCYVLIAPYSAAAECRRDPNGGEW